MGIGQMLDATVIETRQKCVWVKTADRVRGRIYPEPGTLALIQVDDPVSEMEVLEVRDKYVLLDGSMAEADKEEPSEPKPDEEDAEEP